MNRKKREQLIFSAAIKKIARQGYEQTSVSDIIEEAGVARGTFYLYFKSKKELFSAILENFLLDVSRGVSFIKINPHLPSDLLTQTRDAANDLLKTVATNKQLIKILLKDTETLDPEFAQHIAHYFQQMTQNLSHQINQGIAQGLFKPCDSTVASICILGGIKEIILSWINLTTFELEPTITGLIDYLLSSLLAIHSGESHLTNLDEQKISQIRDLNFH